MRRSIISIFYYFGMSWNCSRNCCFSHPEEELWRCLASSGILFFHVVSYFVLFLTKLGHSNRLGWFRNLHTNSRKSIRDLFLRGWLDRGIGDIFLKEKKQEESRKYDFKTYLQSLWTLVYMRILFSLCDGRGRTSSIKVDTHRGQQEEGHKTC